MDNGDRLKIDTSISRRYEAFDRSGKLPFSIVFGLCRRSRSDQDPRPVVLNTTKTIFDVPYALTKNLLTLYEHDADCKQEVVLDCSHLQQLDRVNGILITLSSPVGRTESRFEAFTVYQYPIHPDSELASLFKIGKQYTIRSTGKDLGVKRYAYGQDEQSLQSSETAEMVGGRTSGRATFTVVRSLTWPPPVEVHLRRYVDKTATENTTAHEGIVVLEVSISNTGDQAISLQTRGQQRFLEPWGPFQPEGTLHQDMMPLILNNVEKACISCLQVVDSRTGAIVKEAKQSTGIVPLTVGVNSKTDLRPKLADLVTLKPGEPFVKRLNVNGLFSKLPDGEYGIRLPTRGVWWCFGAVEDFMLQGEDRVPRRLFKTRIPPVLLQCDDTAHLQVKNSRCVR